MIFDKLGVLPKNRVFLRPYTKRTSDLFAIETCSFRGDKGSASVHRLITSLPLWMLLPLVPFSPCIPVVLPKRLRLPVLHLFIRNDNESLLSNSYPKWPYDCCSLLVTLYCLRRMLLLFVVYPSSLFPTPAFSTLPSPPSSPLHLFS